MVEQYSKPSLFPVIKRSAKKSNILNKIKFFNTHHLPPKDVVFRRPQPCRLTSNGLQTYRLSKKICFQQIFFDKLKLQKKLHFIDNQPRSVGSVHPPFPISGEPSLRAAALNNDFVFVYSLCFIALP